MLRSVSVIVLDPVAVFEFGLAVEVFGVDRSDEGLEPFDFRVCGVEPGRPLATKNADPFTITPQLGLDSVLGTDLVIVAPTLAEGRRGLSARGARRAAAGVRRGGDHPQPLLGILHPRRGRPAGRPPLHDALDVRRRDAAPVPDRPGGSAGAVRRGRPDRDERGHRGRHRREPAPRPLAPRHGGGHQDRPPDGGAAAARRWPAAVRGHPDPRVPGRQPRWAADLGPGAPRRRAQRVARWPLGR